MKRFLSCVSFNVSSFFSSYIGFYLRGEQGYSEKSYHICKQSANQISIIISFSGEQNSWRVFVFLQFICAACGGSGRQEYAECTRCKGSLGNTELCPTCSGKGYVTKSRLVFDQYVFIADCDFIIKDVLIKNRPLVKREHP